MSALRPDERAALARDWEPTPWQCPDCRHPLRRVTDPRAADRFICTTPRCGRVWIVVGWSARGPRLI